MVMSVSWDRWWQCLSWPLSKIGALEYLTRLGLDALKQTGTHENAREIAGFYAPTSACWRTNRHWQSDCPFEPAPISWVSKLAHTFTPLARCVGTEIRAITAPALWWTAGGKKKNAATRLLRDEKLTYPVRRFVFPLIYQLQAYCNRSDNDKKQCQVPESRDVEFLVESSKRQQMARAVNNIVTIASSKNTRAVLLNDQWQSLSQTFIGTVNRDPLLTQTTAASIATIPFCRHWCHSGERRGIKTCFIWSTPLCHLTIGLLWHFQPKYRAPIGLKQFRTFAAQCAILHSSSSFARLFSFLSFW